MVVHDQVSEPKQVELLSLGGSVMLARRKFTGVELTVECQSQSTMRNGE